MLKKYSYEVEIAPIQISWTEELIQDEDSGDFYVKLVPHVDNATGTTETSIGVLGAMAKNRIAQQNRKIFEEIKRDTAKEVEKQSKMQARIQYNKSHGQRWNKKV